MNTGMLLIFMYLLKDEGIKYINTLNKKKIIHFVYKIFLKFVEDIL